MADSAPEVVARAIESTPHVALSGLIICGISVQDWYVLLAGGFIILQAGYFVWDKFIRDRAAKEKVNERIE